MPAKLTAAIVALVAATALAACGSATSSSSTAGSSTTSSTPTSAGSSATTSAAPSTSTTATTTTVHGRTVVAHLSGTTGKPATPATAKHFSAIHRARVRAHINGLQGLSLPQKAQTLAGGVAAMWQAVFQNSASQLPVASLVMVADTPSSCGSTQVTANSPPEYCPSTASVDLPLGYLSSKVAPLGDSALLLLISDLYGYHVENAIGAFSAGYTSAQLQKMDSCFSGVYFYYAESQRLLQPTDEEGVNKLLALEAPVAGKNLARGAVTATDLATAFNQGIISNLSPKVCVPPHAG